MEKNYEYKCESCGYYLEQRDNMFICDAVNGCNKSIEIKEGLRGTANGAHVHNLVLENNVWMIESPGSQVARSIIKEDNIKIIRVEMKPLLTSMNGKHPI